MKYAYIFDADGVLANTMESHFICYALALKEVDVPIDKQKFFSQAGMTGGEQIRYFCERAGRAVTDGDVSRIYSRKRELYEHHLDAATQIACNVQLLRMLRANDVPVAIATGCSRLSLLPLLEKFQLEVDAVVTAEDVARGKPNPDLFLLAAERLGMAARYCVVVEDSDAGIAAAEAAGMKALRFYNNEAGD